MTNKRDLKHFLRYDGNGKIIPGGNILQRKIPKVGKWVEGTAYLCCNECPILVYGVDIMMDNIVSDEAGNTTFTFTTVGSAVLIAFTNNEVVIDSITISANTTDDWIVSSEIFMLSDNLAFRRVCTNGVSEPIYLFNGENPT